MAKLKGRVASDAPASVSGGEPASTVVFVGFMGSGKSSAAKLLAEELGIQATDVDQLVEGELGCSIETFFEREGEAAFREIEERVTLRALEEGGVLALGGGAILSDRVRAALQSVICVYLECDPENAFARVNRAGRPLARDREQFLRLYHERLPLYESVAGLIIPAVDQSVVRRALPTIVDLAQNSPALATKVVWASTPSADYPVLFGRGALTEIRRVWPGGRPFLISDSDVAGHYLESVNDSLGEIAGSHIIPAGEQHKTFAKSGEVLREMAKARVARDDTVVALGGGVVGDIAGFCAAVYQRGIRVVQIPTTLVAQVDSAFGGKTGVDLPEAKNYVGVIHQPAAVVCDPEVLKTLPERELAAGFAEVIKTALLAGGPLWEEVQRSEDWEADVRGTEGRKPQGVAGSELRGAAGRKLPPDEVILSCARAKLDVVRSDERDQGLRAVLNLGHTVGHAIEAATGYERYRHGEAVGLGLLVALRLSEQQAGLAPRVREQTVRLLEAWGLPRYIEGVSREEIEQRLELDKKVLAGRLRWVLLEEPGRAVISQEVDSGMVASVIDELFQARGKR